MKLNLRSLQWLALGGSLMLFSNGRWIIPAATWLYPVFFLRFMRMNKPGRGVLLLILTSALVQSICFWKMIPMPRSAYFFVTIIGFNIFSLVFLADRLLAIKINGFLSTLIFPFLWCGIEYCLSLTPKGTWFSLAYTQSGNLSLLQLASITGIWGISFMITWFASVVNWTWARQFEWVKIGTGTIIFVSVGVSVLLFGVIRIHFSPGISKSIRIASIVHDRQINSKIASCKWDNAISISTVTQQLEDNLLEKTRQAAEAGAKMVVWQESAGFIPKTQEELFVQRAASMAASEKIYLIMTLWSVPEDYPRRLVENKLIIIDTGGKIQLTYFKSHPAPPEPIVKGDGGLPVIEAPFGKIASAICFDAEFQGFIRQAGIKKAGILFLPSNDWNAIDPIHTHMAILQAIENGFSLVRPAGQGLSVVTDNHGNIISSMDFFKTDEQILLADTPIAHCDTVYVLLGDYFAWICILGFLALFLFCMYKKVLPIGTLGRISKNLFMKKIMFLLFFLSAIEGDNYGQPSAGLSNDKMVKPIRCGVSILVQDKVTMDMSQCFEKIFEKADSSFEKELSFISVSREYGNAYIFSSARLLPILFGPETFDAYSEILKRGPDWTRVFKGSSIRF